jgi:hypothetical protein
VVCSSAAATVARLDGVVRVRVRTPEGIIVSGTSTKALARIGRTIGAAPTISIVAAVGGEVAICGIAPIELIGRLEGLPPIRVVAVITLIPSNPTVRAISLITTSCVIATLSVIRTVAVP